MARYYVVKDDVGIAGNSSVKTSAVDWTFDNSCQFSKLLQKNITGNVVVTAGSLGVSYQTFNGINWTNWSNFAPANFPSNPRAIKYAAGRFIVVGDGVGQAFSSSDGLSWNAVLCTGNTGTSNRMTASYDNTIAVAIQKGATTMKVSSDGGLTWSNPSTPINTATYGNLVGIFYSRGVNLFTAITYVSGTQTYYNHTSGTGATWSTIGTATGISSSVNATLEFSDTNSTGVSIAWVSGSASAYISTANTSGGQWTAVTLPVGAVNVSYTNNRFNLFNGANGAFRYSTTGETASWTQENITAPSFAINDYIIVNETLPYTLDLTSNVSVAKDFLRNRDLPITATVSSEMIAPIETIANATVSIVDSLIGQRNITANVTTTTTSLPNKFWGQPWSMIYAESKWVGVKNNSDTAATSTDGAVWTAQTLPSVAHWNTIAHDGTSFVTVATDSNKAAYSADGITWSSSTLPTSRKWHCVTAGGTTIVAVASESDQCAVSTNGGATWTEYAMPVTANWTSIAWNGTVFCAISDSDVAATSTNGTSWTQRTMPSNIHYNAIAWGLGKFMAVASGPTDKAATSPDGITWTEITMPQSADWTSVGLGIGDPNV